VIKNKLVLLFFIGLTLCANATDFSFLSKIDSGTQFQALCPYADNNPPWPFSPPGPICLTKSNGYTTGPLVADGCQANTNDASKVLTQSVVGMYYPNIESGVVVWNFSCSGSVVGSNWVLTAGHCVASSTPGAGEFYGIESVHPVLVLPWQPNGSMPFNIYPDDKYFNQAYKVGSIYIPYAYNYYEVPESDQISYGNQKFNNQYIHADIALLKTVKDFPISEPNKMVALKIAQYTAAPGNPVWLVGYGDNNITPPYGFSGYLNYHNIYYMTSIYPGNDGKALNYGEVYSLGTLPLPKPGSGGTKYAWKFDGDGDSGGPLLYLDEDNKFEITGTLTGGLYCNNAGFYARLPYPYVAHASMPYYYNEITAIINGSATGSNTRCIASPYGKCPF